jgi:phthalate 4,5-cis-dihydrodiol dehydrogenase
VTRSLRFGIVGLGRAAAATAPAIFRHPHAQIVAAADVNPAALHEFQAIYPSRVYERFEDLCADPDVDAIYIATPTHLHTTHVLQAVGAEKHVIVEKPLAITLDDAQHMIDAVDQAGVQLIVGQSQSYEPPVRALRSMVRTREFGALRMISGWYFNDWLYRPRLAAELDTRQGGGVVFRQGAHHFDVVRLIGGGLLRSVRASTGVWDAARPTEGSYSAFLEFEDGAVANLVYSGNDHFHTVELTRQSEGGFPVDPSQLQHAAARRALDAAADAGGDASLKRRSPFGGARRDAAPPNAAYFGLTIVSCEHADIRQTPTGLQVYADRSRWEVDVPLERSGRDLMIEELYAAVVHDRPPLHTARWARATLEVSLAVLESARTRAEVRLHHQVPVTEELN